MLPFKFEQKILKLPNGCWEWQGRRDSDMGYGKFRAFNQTLAHRVSYILYVRPFIEKDMCVLHKCDNPPCVNPEHLFIGTRDTNNKDRAAKGRTVIYNSAKTHCKRGHVFDEVNTYFRNAGNRMCRACERQRVLKKNRELAMNDIPRDLKRNHYSLQCPKGHIYSQGNEAFTKSGSRYCKHCNRDRVNSYRSKRCARVTV